MDQHFSNMIRAAAFIIIYILSTKTSGCVICVYQLGLRSGFSVLIFLTKMIIAGGQKTDDREQRAEDREQQTDYRRRPRAFELNPFPQSTNQQFN